MKSERYKRSRIIELTKIDETLLASYEEAGLITPKNEGGESFYSHEELEVIEMIERLTSDLGVNLPGVEVILNMRGQMLAMQQEFDRVIDDVRRGIIKELSVYEERFRRPMIENRGGLPSKVRIKE